MILRKIYSCLVLMILAGHMAPQAQSAVLFSDDFSTTDVLDTAKWTAEGSGVFVFNARLSGLTGVDDNALVINGDFNYDDGIRSVMSFNRSQNLTATFKVFRDGPTLTGSFAGFSGPWVNTSSLPGGGTPSLEQMEAGLLRENGTGGFQYTEDTTNFSGSPTVSSGLFNALAGATNKAAAVTIRVTIGGATGARLEWSTDGFNFTEEFDTIGMAAGTNYTGSNLVSNSDPLRLFFGGFGDFTTSRFWIDDIVVSDNSFPAVNISPATLDFTVDGSSSTTQQTRVLNIGNNTGAAVQLTTVSLTGLEPWRFRIASPTSTSLPISIPNGTTQSIQVVFDPKINMPRNDFTAAVLLGISGGETTVNLSGDVIASVPFGWRKLFEEQWVETGGAVQADNWDFVGNDGFFFQVFGPGGLDPDTTDWAWVVTGGDGDYNDGIRSKQSFNRGNSLRVTFTLWAQAAAPFAKAYAGINGPWINRNTIPGGLYPTFSQIEAGIGRYDSDSTPTLSTITYAEDSRSLGDYVAGPKLQTQFVSDLMLVADRKHVAIKLRATLGDSSGALLEYARPGSNSFEVVRFTNGAPADSRELPAGANFYGARVGGAQQVWLFFAGEFGQAWVDDIVVEDNTGDPPGPELNAANHWEFFE